MADVNGSTVLVSPLGAMLIGLIPGFICCYAINLKNKLGYDDSLDVVGVHLVGGILGTVLIGFFATKEMVGGYTNGAKAGLFYGGGASQLVSQIEQRFVAAGQPGLTNSCVS